MATEPVLTITKNTTWRHTGHGLPFNFGGFTSDMIGDRFLIYQMNGANRSPSVDLGNGQVVRGWLSTNVTVIDGSNIYTSLAPNALMDALKSLDYPGFKYPQAGGGGGDVTSVNGQTGDVTVNGDNISVDNPDTGTETTLNQALSDVYGAVSPPDLSAYVKGDGTQATDVDLNGKDLNNVSDATIAGILTLNGGYNSLLKATSGVVSTASAGVDFEAAQTGTGFVRSASGTKTYIGETGSGNVVRDTSPLLSNPTFNTQATGTNNLTGANTAFVQQELAAYDAKTKYISLASDYVLTSQTAPQKIFNVGASGNGALQAKANTLYSFYLQMSLSTLSTSSSTFSFKLDGTAGIASIIAESIAAKAANTPGTPQFTQIVSTAETTIVTATATATGKVMIHGYFRTSTAGTVVLSIGQSIAAAGTVLAGSSAMFHEVGSSSFTYSTGID